MTVLAQHPVLAAAIVVVFSSALVAPAAATDPRADPERLQAVKRALERVRDDEAVLRARAADQGLHLDRLKRSLVEIAAQTRRLYDRIAARNATLESLFVRKARTATMLGTRRAELSHLLAALQRLARRPVRMAMLAGTAEPLPTLRGGMLLQRAVPQVDHDARALAAELRGLANLRRSIAHKQLERKKTIASLSARRRALAGLINERSKLAVRWRKASASAEANALRLASEAEGIEQLLSRVARMQKGVRLRAEDLNAPPGRAVSLVVTRQAKPAYSPLPAIGRVIKRFGGKMRGTTIRTRAEAEVIAPRAGQVVFAGRFRGYGQLLIIRHAGQYHVLLAGLSRLYAGLGDKVLAGEPIGAMGSKTGSANHLYIELRQSGRPINPLPWLTANRIKVSG